MIEKAIDHFHGSRSALCKAIGMTPQFLSQVCTGKRPLPPRYAVLIEEVTGGEVTAADLLPDVFSPRSTPKLTPGRDTPTTA
ncbi:YdaS antitoxin of YdaST toxin-antitoxin system [Kushneria sinocarnis]|uniref:YdaS antitoxin of YdaST toxin-antitoxin system n=1 Tax=Kushneria sinocarnis TaxID=595502 RepID=A0A420WVP2_9GAMM|nr:YdaS antitoxin of YdaST toxin-antitoxin system [Kushneria sinocarnis]